MSGWWHFLLKATSRRTVAAGEVALIVCCIATESSEIATFVQPRSIAIAADQTHDHASFL